MSARSTFTLLLLCALILCPLLGCESRPPYDKGDTTVVPLDDRTPGEGLGSKDLTTATDKMVAEIAAIPEIRAAGDKTIVVMGRVRNRTSNPNRDFTIYLARIRANLNRSGAKKNIGFVESRDDMIAERERELDRPEGYSSKADYVLKGVFYDSKLGKGTTWLMTFQLTSLLTGDIVWEGNYEVKFQ